VMVRSASKSGRPRPSTSSIKVFTVLPKVLM
jgi:hypothetical protein